MAGNDTIAIIDQDRVSETELLYAFADLPDLLL